MNLLSLQASCLRRTTYSNSTEPAGKLGNAFTWGYRFYTKADALQLCLVSKVVHKSVQNHNFFWKNYFSQDFPFWASLLLNMPKRAVPILSIYQRLLGSLSTYFSAKNLSNSKPKRMDNILSTKAVFNPDGNFLVTMIPFSQDVCVWKPNKKHAWEKETLRHPSGAQDVVIHPNGDIVVLIAMAVYIWRQDPNTREWSFKSLSGLSLITGITLLPPDKLAVVHNRQTSLWQPRGNCVSEWQVVETFTYDYTPFTDVGATSEGELALAYRVTERGRLFSPSTIQAQWHSSEFAFSVKERDFSDSRHLKDIWSLGAWFPCLQLNDKITALKTPQGAVFIGGKNKPLSLLYHTPNGLDREVLIIDKKNLCPIAFNPKGELFTASLKGIQVWSLDRRILVKGGLSKREVLCGIAVLLMACWLITSMYRSNLT